MASAPAPHNAYSMYRNPASQAAPMTIGLNRAQTNNTASYSISPAGPTSVKARRTVSSQGVLGRRRAGTGTGKRPDELASSLQSGRGMSPATLTSQNLHKMNLGPDDDGDEAMMDGDGDEGDSGSTGSTPAPGTAGRKSRSKKEKGQTFQCEKCSKVYRHPQCLIKHRWEHTQYWKEASKLMLSKHQQVQMLEAAAILFSPPQTLPVEKQYWPAAVSPPSSGLLGSAGLNIDTIRTTGTPTGVSSSFGASSWTRSTSIDTESRDGRLDDDDGTEDDYGSPETDPNPELDTDEAMFKIEDIDDVEEAPAAMPIKRGRTPASSAAAASANANGAQGNKLALAVSAPVMGFFDDHHDDYAGAYGRGRR